MDKRVEEIGLGERIGTEYRPLLYGMAQLADLVQETGPCCTEWLG